ncbi:alpha-L-rhamnosidase [Jiangella asiatica]|uniref:alpha-L-rhamnosidase n=2 Tax=Jiangella asiatica TaxID=2530372 RepID=A0A4R5DAR4_9ACTN|nr:alpha-L-rhamnosidase [Jiangella asiatica]
MSWRLPEGTREQVAYQLRAGRWDSGRVESDQSILVPYDGPDLASGERVEWTVRVWTDAGESDWAEPSWWEMGLLDPADWVARWVEPAEPDRVRAQVVHPAHLFRGKFTLDDAVERARLYVTAHGIYEFFVNGDRVGDLELTPGFTSYRSRLQVQTFDVAPLLRAGENVLGAVLSDGWFRGQTSGFRHIRSYGDTLALLAQLDVLRPDGTLRRVGTGPDWLSTTGSIVAADLVEGQVVDLRRDPAGWHSADAVLEGWSPVTVVDHDLTRLCWSPSPPVRRVQELRPVAVTRPAPDRQVIDLGQNLNGWVRVTSLGPAGTTLSLTHGEALDASGDVTLDTLSPDADDVPGIDAWPWDMSMIKRSLQVDRVTAAGTDGEVFEPRHTTHGFQYVRVEGHPDDLTADDVTGVVVHTDLRRTGSFECSDVRINRLHEAAVWSFRGNACDIPTDCPTRERAGWTGDWQIFVPTAAFLYDVAGFSTKWLRDLAADQRPDGTVEHLAPNSVPTDLTDNPVPPGAAGWADAAVIVPWEIYRAYGDVRLLKEQWPSMTAWVEYAATAAKDRRHPDRAATRPTPGPHERYLWDTGFHFGEWLEPGEHEMDMAKRAAADHGDLATAYLHHSADLLGQIAAVLGDVPGVCRYADLAGFTRWAWQEEFLRPDGTLATDTQAAHVRALAFGLVPDDLRAQVAGRLVELIRDAGTHLGTGFLATPYLLPVLADTGHLDVAYELLFQDTEPSWLTMIDRGATTIWEAWNGIDEHGTSTLSLNHYSKGAVVSFLHRYVAGIQLLNDHPAYRRFRIAPRPGGGLTTARATHDSPYGRIESAWHLDGDRFTLDVTVPPGTTAEVHLPDGRRHDAAPGTATFRGLATPALAAATAGEEGR